MQCSVYTKDGAESGKVELADEVFCLDYNEALVWQAVNAELANRRLGTASTLDRGEVHGSNAKPYRQKGTGRARRGDKKSPLIVGGGTMFGPKPRDFSYSLPKKAKRAALKSILSLKVKSGMLKVVEDFTVESGKTRDFAKIIGNFSGGERTTVIVNGEDALLKRSGRNIPYVHFLSHKRLAPHTLFYARSVVVMKGAVEELNKNYGGEN